MSLIPLAKEGHYVHVYDFRVKTGTGDEFIELFNAFDYDDSNSAHKSPAQVKDGALCRDVNDPDHFWLLGEWNDIAVHAQVLKYIREEMKPEFVKLVENNGFAPKYGKVVSATPQHILDKARA
jgi:hypothetical protein